MMDLKKVMPMLKKKSRQVKKYILGEQLLEDTSHYNQVYMYMIQKFNQRKKKQDYV